jgi:hypothetical protein
MRRGADGDQVLLVGADNFPLPIPLKKNGSGQWFSDTLAGKDELLSRRIGRNELGVIDIYPFSRRPIVLENYLYQAQH